MKIFIFLFLFLFSVSTSFGQSPKLAKEYYMTGEYEKAAELYKRLHKKASGDIKILENYIYSLMEIERYREAEVVIIKRLKSNKDKALVYVLYGRLYERQEDEKNADKYYQKAIKSLKFGPSLVNSLVNLFNKEARYDLSIAAYLEGLKYKENSRSLFDLGGLYWLLNKKDKGIYYHLQCLEQFPGYLHSVQNFYRRKLADSDLLLSKLYQKIQEKPDAVQFAKLLQGIFVMKKMYKKAFWQAKSLDKRLKGNGSRVYLIGTTAAGDKDYKTAEKAFKYIVNTKNKNSSYFLKAKKGLLKTKLNLIIENPNYTKIEFDSLVVEYDSILSLYGKNNQTVEIMMDYAKLNTEYAGEYNKAIKILNELLGLGSIEKPKLAEAKLLLGDYYTIDGEVWEATLLYSQVDKEFKEADLGERARFKNAKLSYYNGEFEWAQEQFDFLKSATSKLISNDAIDLSVFITDNLGLDTSATAMALYAKADLLVFQHKYIEAQNVLDELLKQFPEHTLEDDVLYIKAQIYSDKRDWDKAIFYYNDIVEKFPEEIRADNALYNMALIYELNLKDNKKAISLFEKLFLDYSGSTFAVDARNRYRYLLDSTKG